MYARDLTGKKFGRLTVISFAESRKIGRVQKSKRFWNCVCDCGATRVLPADTLLQENTRSCGCLRADICRETGKSAGPRLPKGEPGFNSLYGKYKRGAIHRGLSFNLDKDAFRRLTQLDCYYCGAAPATEISGRSSSGHVIENSRYIYNGVDRLDPKLGYHAANCVTACKNCNLAKQSLSYAQFMNLVEAIHSNRVAQQQRVANS